MGKNQEDVWTVKFLKSTKEDIRRAMTARNYPFITEAEYVRAAVTEKLEADRKAEKEKVSEFRLGFRRRHSSESSESSP